jgi:hypothetical protein
MKCWRRCAGGLREECGKGKMLAVLRLECELGIEGKRGGEVFGGLERGEKMRAARFWNCFGDWRRLREFHAKRIG